jgi:hypothetical protein
MAAGDGGRVLVLCVAIQDAISAKNQYRRKSMTLNEFKAWFDGYTEDMQHPSAKQWKRIKERIAEIDDKPTITEKVFVDRYVRPYWTDPYWLRPYYATFQTGVGMSDTKTYGDKITSFVAKGVNGFNSSESFLALGRAEAEHERVQQA